ncbi:hypothetical protein pb186bvf_004111 [Paramecium bursaria]
MIQNEDIQTNKEKINYIERYDPLNDYIQASQIKTTKAQNEQDINLQLKDLDLKELNKYLTSIVIEEPPKIKIFEDGIDFLEQIKDQILCGYNCLIYGYGSKQKLLERIAQNIINEHQGYIIFQIKGYRPQASIKMSLIHLIDSLRPNEQKKEKFSIENTLQWLQNYLKKNNKKLLFLIHSIDGKNLWSQQNQELLSKISFIKKIQILASFDNYRYSTVGKLNNTLFNSCNTYAPYIEEIQQCFDQQINKQNREDGLWYIIESLNDNQNTILTQLARLLQNQSEGVTFEHFFTSCKDEMIISYRDTLKDNLKELLQSGIVEIKKEKYIINHSDKIIQQLASRQLV